MNFFKSSKFVGNFELSDSIIYDDFDIVDFYFNKESAIEYCDKIVKNYEIENTPIKVCVVKCIPGNDSNGSRYIETIHFSSHHAHIIDDELY